MKNQETSLEYATIDPSLHYNHSEPKSKADWRQEYVRLLKIRDYDSAERLKAQNMISDECVNGGCEDCNFKWCKCSRCHSAVQFALEHPSLKSLAHVESERDEMEAA